MYSSLLNSKILPLTQTEVEDTSVLMKAETTVMFVSMLLYSIYCTHFEYPWVVECPGAGKKLTVKCPGAGNFFCASAWGVSRGDGQGRT